MVAAQETTQSWGRLILLNSANFAWLTKSLCRRFCLVFWTCLKRKFNEKARKKNVQYVEAEEIKGKKRPWVPQPTLARNSDFLRKPKKFGFYVKYIVFF